MTEEGALDVFSGGNSESDDRSCQILRENGHTRGTSDVIAAEMISSTAQTSSKEEVVGNVSPSEQPETCDLDTVSKKGLKRAREAESMDHSGLERKVPRVLSRVGAIQCLSPLSLEELKLLSPADAGEELARCMDEPKVNLIRDIVRSLGIEKSFEIFNETAEIQSKGGLIAAKGNYKKSPGGVFLALVKKAATKEQKHTIFKYDKQKKLLKKRERSKRLRREKRARENELKKRREDWEKGVLQGLQDNPDAHVPEWDEDKGEPVHLECNMQKRLPSSGATNSNGTDLLRIGQTEPTEMEVDSRAIGLGPIELKTAAVVSDAILIQQEILAAEEFEGTSDCNLEFDLHVD